MAAVAPVQRAPPTCKYCEKQGYKRNACVGRKRRETKRWLFLFGSLFILCVVVIVLIDVFIISGYFERNEDKYWFHVVYVHVIAYLSILLYSASWKRRMLLLFHIIVQSGIIYSFVSLLKYFDDWFSMALVLVVLGSLSLFLYGKRYGWSTFFKQ